MAKDGKSSSQQITVNRKALRDYLISEKLEAGIELLGSEVKSIRAGQASINEAFALVENGQVFLHQMHILPYSSASHFNHDPVRIRRLLLKKKEIARLFGQTSAKGFTLVPLRLYYKFGRVKVELGLGKGKKEIDKRETLKRKTATREAERAMSAKNQK